MIFISGELYRKKYDDTMFICYKPYITHEIKSNDILLFLDYVEYCGKSGIFVKRFFINDKIVIDDQQTFDNPEEYFEHIKLLNT